MKRFQLFGIDAYYPLGGFSDRVGQFDTFEDMLAWWTEHKNKTFEDRENPSGGFGHYMHDSYQLADITTDRFSYWQSYEDPKVPDRERP